MTPGPLPVITTDRLVLRPHRLSDADAIADTLSDFAVTRMLARVPAPYDRQDALDWLVPVTAGGMPDWQFAITAGDDAHILLRQGSGDEYKQKNRALHGSPLQLLHDIRGGGNCCQGGAAEDFISGVLVP